MRNIYMVIVPLFFLTKSYSQPFTLLANDPSGDAVVTSVADIQSLYYRIDMVQDSIWFKIQSYNSMDPNGDVGIMFGFDTNQVITDGNTWNGSNLSMKYDHALIVFQNVMSPNYFGYLFNGSLAVPVPTTVLRPDSFTFIISTPFSQVDNDGTFNLLYGSGAFDIIVTRDVFDEAPNTGYLSVSPATGIAEPGLHGHAIRLYPNPASDLLVIQNVSTSQKNYCVRSVLGTEILKGQLSEEMPVDLSCLPPGPYLFEAIGDDGKNQSKMFLKMND